MAPRKPRPVLHFDPTLDFRTPQGHTGTHNETKLILSSNIAQTCLWLCFDGQAFIL